MRLLCNAIISEMEQNNINQLLNSQNIELKQKVQYLETKIKEIIQNQIEQKKQSQIHLST